MGTHIQALGKTLQRFSARYIPWFRCTSRHKPTSLTRPTTPKKKLKRRHTTHRNTPLLHLFTPVPPNTIRPQGFPPSFSPRHVLNFTLHTNKHLSFPVEDTGKTCPPPPHKAFTPLILPPKHNILLSSSLSPPSNPTTHNKFGALLHPLLPCRPPPPSPPNPPFLPPRPRVNILIKKILTRKMYFLRFFSTVLHFHLSLYQYKGDFQTTHTQNHVFTNRTGRKTFLSVHFYVLPVFWVQIFTTPFFFPPIPLYRRYHYEPITHCAKPLLALSPKMAPISKKKKNRVWNTPY